MKYKRRRVMENCLRLPVFVILLLSAAFVLLLSKKVSVNCRRRPPGPPGWPIIGNILQLGTIPHKSLYDLNSKYGPLLWLKLGSVNTLVIQSSKAASELFKHHDNNFCDRQCPVAYTAHNYHQGSIGFGRYGPSWRVHRRLCSTEIFVNKRINETAFIRRKCVDNMLQCIEDDVAAAQARGESGEVILAHYLFVMAFNVVGNLTLSRDLLNPQSKEGMEFFSAMDKVMLWGGKPDLADFLPWLKWLDPQGIKRNMKREMGRGLKIVSGFVKKRVADQNLTKEKTKDFLDSILEYKGDGKEGPNKISYQNINIIILEMFFAGSETTSTTIEWVTHELFRNPQWMTEIKEELDRVVGRNRKVEETDINELESMKAVVKESIRLHTPAPLLLPRNTIKDTEFMGYFIPRNTQVLVNAWAIARDPECWEDPVSFKPERFLEANIDFRGQNFELIPFGAGRRICLGISLAEREVHLAVASLIHHFDWELPENVTPETIDMNERVGITLRKLEPLKAIPKKRIM